MSAMSCLSTTAIRRRKAPHGLRGPRSRWASAIAAARGSERATASVARMSAASRSSLVPNTARRITSSVSSCMSPSVCTGRPRGQRAACSSATSWVTAR